MARETGDGRPTAALTGSESEGPIPQPADGQVLVRNLWLSSTTTQRGWMACDTYVPMGPLGEVMRAAGVGQVIESHPDFKPADLVLRVFGWQDYDATDGKGFMEMRRLPLGVAPNLALSLFGITGPTAYLGIIQVGQVRAGETVVVSGAADSTGSVAGQIAKIKGRPVIGTAGAPPNVSDWSKRRGSTAPSLTSENVGERLSALCPNGIDGIDVFFNNVGGTVLNGVLAHRRQSEDRAVRRDCPLQRRRTTAGSGKRRQPHRPHGRIHCP
jgi:NADPH-dependent curcumin reductase